jgi:hypothetical protein
VFHAFRFCHCHSITHFQEVNDLEEVVSIFFIVKESYHGSIIVSQHLSSAPVSVRVATDLLILAGAQVWYFIVDNQIDISVILRQIRVARYHDSRKFASEIS